MQDIITKPSFIGIGAQKAATSWVYLCISEHPDICIPIKDVHFFSRDRNWLMGVDWYYNIYKCCRHQKSIGEISTSYLYTPESALRIKKYVPNARIFVILRNPVERAFSHYNNHIKSGKVSSKVSFKDALKLNPEYIENGLYKKHLENYLKVFSINEIKIILYDDICQNPRKVLNELFDYLGVDKEFKPSLLDKKVNIARVPASILIGNLLSNVSIFLKKIGLFKFTWYLRKVGVVSLLHKLNSKKKANYLKIDNEQRTKLINIFKDDIEWIEKILDRRLDEWHI
jgi:hypothetical protein